MEEEGYEINAKINITNEAALLQTTKGKKKKMKLCISVLKVETGAHN